MRFRGLGGNIMVGLRFVDQHTGKPLTVYVEPATGERAYVQAWRQDAAFSLRCAPAMKLS